MAASPMKDWLFSFGGLTFPEESWLACSAATWLVGFIGARWLTFERDPLFVVATLCRSIGPLYVVSLGMWLPPPPNPNP